MLTHKPHYYAESTREAEVQESNYRKLSVIRTDQVWQGSYDEETSGRGLKRCVCPGL